MPPLDVPEVDTAALLGAAERKDLGSMPEVSEIEIIRHFTRMSTWNYAIDLGMYPLGSCTMKYNPRVNEAVARVEGIGHIVDHRFVAQGRYGGDRDQIQKELRRRFGRHDFAWPQSFFWTAVKRAVISCCRGCLPS